MVTRYSKEYKKGFILDEARLRNIENIIRNRLHSVCPNFVFQVEMRSVESIYYANSLDEFITQTSTVTSKIDRIEVTGRDSNYSNDFKTNIDFVKSDPIKLTVTGPDKDIVSLLYVDLNEYIDNVVAYLPQIPDVVISFVLLIFVALGCFLWLHFAFLFSPHQYSKPSVEQINTALKSGNLQTKIDMLLQWYLHEAESISLFSIIILFVGGMFAGSALFSLGTHFDIFKTLFDRKYFAFGRHKDSHIRRERILSNILWIFLVGFFVSFLAGIIVWKLTKS